MKKRFMVTEEVDIEIDVDSEDGEKHKYFNVLAVTETPDGWGYVIEKGGRDGVRVSKKDLSKLRSMLDAAAREQ